MSDWNLSQYAILKAIQLSEGRIENPLTIDKIPENLRKNLPSQETINGELVVLLNLGKVKTEIVDNLAFFVITKEGLEFIEHTERKLNELSDGELNKKTIELLKDKNLLRIIQNDMHKCIIGNDKLKVTLWIKTFSRFRRPFLDLLVDDPSSGKSYIVKALLRNYFEKEKDYKVITTATQKSFYYVEEDWANKILFLMELQGLDEETVPIFRDWFSEGWDLGLEHRTVNVKREGQVLKLGKPPYTIITTPDREIEKQLGDRGWRNSVEKGLEQQQKIKTFEDFKRITGIEDLEITGDPRIKNIPNCIDSTLKVIIPYANLIQFPYMDKTRINRDIPKFYDLIELITLIHQHQRTIIEHKGKKYVISTLEDFFMTIYYGFEQFLTTVTEMDKDMKEVLKILDGTESLTTMDVVKLGRFNYDKTYKILRQLEKTGTVGGHREGRDKMWDFIKRIENATLVVTDENVTEEKLEDTRKIISLLMKDSGFDLTEDQINDILGFDKSEGSYHSEIYNKGREKIPNVCLRLNQSFDVWLKDYQTSKIQLERLLQKWR